MDKAQAIEQIDRAILRYASVSSTSQYDDCSDLPDGVVSGLISTLASTIERVAPPDGHHRKALDKLINDFGPSNPVVLPHLPGLLESLKRDWFDGHITGCETTGTIPLEAPGKVTIRWLIDNVEWELWTKVAGIATTLILVGIFIGQFPFVRGVVHSFWPSFLPQEVTQRSSTRSLNSEQVHRIVARTLPFGGQQAEMLVYPGEEATQLGETIHSILSSESHWRVTLDQRREESRSVFGVLIELGETSTSADLMTASELVAALNAEGIDANGPDGINRLAVPAEHRNSPIRITVGRKP
jgi:hypothetical protein